MRLIAYVGIIAVMTAIGSRFGEQYYGGEGPLWGTVVGGVFGVVIVSVLHIPRIGR